VRGGGLRCFQCMDYTLSTDGMTELERTGKEAVVYVTSGTIVASVCGDCGKLETSGTTVGFPAQIR
jgi:hypothetical protein